MSTVKREPDGLGRRARWMEQCLQDLAAGRHAVGCGCDETDSRWTPNGWDVSEDRRKPNACSEIVRCALEMRDYDVQIEGEQNAEA